MRSIRILDAHWTPTVNVLEMLCRCGEAWEHPANRRRVKCPHCGRAADIRRLRLPSDAGKQCQWCCKLAKANGGPLCGLCDGDHSDHPPHRA